MGNLICRRSTFRGISVRHAFVLLFDKVVSRQSTTTMERSASLRCSSNQPIHSGPFKLKASSLLTKHDSLLMYQ